MNRLPEQVAAPAAPMPDHLGQATAVEQSRAVAEVQAAVVVAQQNPRNLDAALAEMRRSCRQPSLAHRAFYAFPRAGETVSGESVYLARELARCWGNIQHAVAELRRDDAAGESEMQAFAWDLQTNTRVATTWYVPHARDTRTGRKQLIDLRDVYENNANQGARRVRECIFAVLPPWFVAEAVELCRATVSDVPPDVLADRIGKAIAAYERTGIDLATLERKVGRPREQWTGADYAELDVLFGSLKRGEIRREDAFPAERVTATEIAAQAAAAPVPAVPAEAPPVEPDAEGWPAVTAPGGQS